MYFISLFLMMPTTKTVSSFSGVNTILPPSTERGDNFTMKKAPFNKIQIFLSKLLELQQLLGLGSIKFKMQRL
jgi:hypothetical protein